ncbi:MAG: hypothetical protein LBP80_04975 [Treponema sp.]|jgi:hypothetical protein|nr:hypothetical protein [Treponema sp.]
MFSRKYISFLNGIFLSRVKSSGLFRVRLRNPRLPGLNPLELQEGLENRLTDVRIRKKEAGIYRLEVTTQYSGSAKPLKTPAPQPSITC